MFGRYVVNISLFYWKKYIRKEYYLKEIRTYYTSFILSFSASRISPETQPNLYNGNFLDLSKVSSSTESEYHYKNVSIINPIYSVPIRELDLLQIDFNIWHFFFHWQ